MNTSLSSAGAVVAASAAATFAKTKAEQVLQPLSEKAVPPAPAQRTAIGADAAGHPENMPPAELADRVAHAAAGEQLTDKQRQKASSALHWAMGLGVGVGYALTARRFPAVRAGRGAVAGATLFAATHGSSLPAAGMQHPPAAMPAAWWGWEAGSHVVYGVVLDTVLRVLDRC